MGKATIISEIGDGQYQIEMKYDGRAEHQAKIDALNLKIGELQTKYDSMPETTYEEIFAKRIVGLQIKSLEKQVEYLQTAFPDDVTFNAWCIDGETGLSGDVGLLEVPGEYEAPAKVNIVAGYQSAVFNKAIHGQLTPPVAMGPWSTFLDKCMLPGWQKFKPVYRFGTIINDSMDYDNDKCDVCLDPEYSSQLNLGVNQNADLANCDNFTVGGLNQFCSDNPTHETCINTEYGGPVFISDAQFAEIESVNSQVNSAHEYKSDASGYRPGDDWNILSTGEKGDCEDFALTKMQELLDLGYNAKDLKIAAVATETVVDHAVLIINTSNRGILVLDNRYDKVRRMSALPYRFVGYQRAGTEWSSYTTKLESVPIEYRDCNAVAFIDGDQVVVRFDNQNFENPKVVGFRSNPNPCYVSNIWAFGGDTYVEWVLNPATGHLQPDVGWFRGAAQYNATSDEWASAARLPHEIEIAGWTYQQIFRLLANVVADGVDKTWFIGGSIRTADYNDAGSPRPEFVTPYSDRLDQTPQTWTARADIADPERSLGHGWYLGGLAYVVGGVEWFNNPDPNDPIYYQDSFNDVDAYNDTTDVWAAKVSPGYRWGHAAFKILGKGYIAGGSSGQYGEVETGSNWVNVLNELKQFDPDAEVWTARQSLSKKWYATGGFELSARSKGYIIGGWSTADELQEYEPLTNTWLARADLLGGGMRAYCGQQVGAIDVGYCATLGPNNNDKWDHDANSWSHVAQSIFTSCSWGQRWTL